MRKYFYMLFLTSLIATGCSEVSNSKHEISLDKEVNSNTKVKKSEPKFATLTPVNISNDSFAKALGVSNSDEICITEGSDTFMSLNYIDTQNPTYSVGFFSVEDCPYNPYDYKLMQNTVANSDNCEFIKKVVNNHTWNTYTYPVNTDNGEAVKVVMMRILNDSTYRNIIMYYPKNEESILSKKAESILNQLNI